MNKQSHPKTIGLRHIALSVNKLQECIDFYKNVIGMAIELETDNYAYLSSGTDNISLHGVNHADFIGLQRLEHFGFACATPQDVDDWYHHCKQCSVNVLEEPKTFGIGTTAFAVLDPSGNEVEFIYHPPLATQKSND